MENFNFNAPTMFEFGEKAYLKSGKLLKQFGAKNILLVIGQGKALAGGLLEKITDSITEEGIEFEILSGVLPNPHDDKVREGIDIVRRKKLDFIFAVGGGSVIDTAKAIAFGALQDKDFWTIFETREDCKSAMPLGCVLTIAAAGSEGSPSTVITNKAVNKKCGYTHNCLIPKFSILCPELTCKLPLYQTACGTVDIFAHAMERYFTPTSDTVFTDKLCESVMSTALECGLKLLEKPEDYQLRANLMWTGTIAHNDICGCGRIQDWASHDISHRLSALYDIAHGAALSIIIPAWMEYVAPADNYSTVCRMGEKVLNLDKGGMTDKEFAAFSIKTLKNIFSKLGMPTSFGETSAKAEDIPVMVEGISFKRGEGLGSFKKLSHQDIENIYKLAAR